jgi:hypothetical protein
MDTVLKVRYVGGFGRAGSPPAETYLSATPDPVAVFAPMIAGHMNVDHTDSIVAMLDHYANLQVGHMNVDHTDSIVAMLDHYANLQVGHMNVDHTDSIVAMLDHYANLQVGRHYSIPSYDKYLPT